ncbi:MAG: dolichyl-phosphate beta-glucosyltransferase [Chthoniobacter sp.]|jgi:dolichyl-phosphate beta-glucosyltransferase|nr:dolichyl-phosphate beta-glucosyltransferase [Chthoniobacter sp.]
MSAAPFLSLVIPAYHEARRLPPTLARLAEFCAGLEFPFEVLIIVERGTDGTLEIAADFAARQAHFHAIDSPVQRGKGHAVRTGMLRARGDHIFYMDADLSVPLPEVSAFLAHFAAHPEIDVLIGNRQHAGSRITRAQSWLRRTMGQTFNRILQACAVTPLRDTQCGFKGFRHAVAQAIFSRQKLDGFAFDIEVLLLAERLGYRIADLPVEWINSPESKVHIVRDSLRMLRDAARVRRLVAETLRR